MSNQSLMNIDFLRQELASATELYAEAETFNREFSIAYDEIFQVIQDLELADKKRETYPLTKDQAMMIIRTLAMVKQQEYVFLSPRRVMISHYKQLLKDRRYRIAIVLTKLFK